ncbi:MAG: hypothetical protein U0670_08255 [Anaerolineae bacterium]
MADSLRRHASQPVLIRETARPIPTRVVATRANARSLLPGLCLLDSFALLIVVLAGITSRNGMDNAPTLLWIGLLLIFVPTALRLLSRSAGRGERIGLVVLLGMALYMVKVLHSPNDFTFHDEFLHWQTVNNILRDQQLFTTNPILPVSTLYPGMEVITSAFAQLSGLSVVESGTILLGLTSVSCWPCFCSMSESEHRHGIAGLATMLYTANSNFLYFDAQFFL